jgi:Tfp pilus assembly protein PilF
MALCLAGTLVACAPPPEGETTPSRVMELRAAAREASARGDDGACVALLEQAVALEPGGAEAWEELGRAREKRGDATGAVQAYEAAILAAPQRYQAHLDLAILCMRSGMTGRARSELQEAVDAAPGNATIHWNYGAALVQVGKPEEARQHLVAALRLDPSLGPAHAELGRVEALAGHTQQALAHFAQAESLGVHSAIFHANWGLALLQGDSPDAAADQLRQAVAADSTQAAWWNHLGVAELQAGRRAPAEGAFRTALSLAPEDDVRFNLANLLVQAGRNAEAEALLSPPPQRADLLALRGLALRGLGRSTEARDCLAAAAGKAPRDVNVLNNYGVLLAETGDVPGALEVWRRVLAIEPANQTAQENLKARGGGAATAPRGPQHGP